MPSFLNKHKQETDVNQTCPLDKDIDNNEKDRHVSSHSHIYFQSDPEDNGVLEQESPKVALQTHMVALIKKKKS